MTIRLRTLTALLAAIACVAAAPVAGAPGPLALERTIPLAGVKGRIDHLAIDLAGRRLFVAALGNDSVEVVDLRSGRQVGRILGQSKPQGLAWLPDRRELVVASGDGQVGFYGGPELKRRTVLKPGDDADNVRIEPGSGRPVVGYGRGALAVIDPAAGRVIRSLALPGHPESFRLAGTRAYVNVPDAARIVVADLASGAQAASWPTPGARFNFPMAIDPASGAIAVVFRLPARLRLLDPASGRTLLDASTCGDADDLFFDPPRKRLYVICGTGHVDILQATGASDYRRLATMASRPGARTGFFSPEDDRLYVAARAALGQPAAILVYRPQP